MYIKEQISKINLIKLKNVFSIILLTLMLVFGSTFINNIAVTYWYIVIPVFTFAFIFSTIIYFIFKKIIIDSQKK